MVSSGQCAVEMCLGKEAKSVAQEKHSEVKAKRCDVSQRWGTAQKGSGKARPRVVLVENS